MNDRKSTVAGSVSPGYVTGGVYVFTREHHPNVLKENENRKK